MNDSISRQRLFDLSDCILCPRACHAARDASINDTGSSAVRTGYCGSDGRIRIAGAMLHYWEEPCISGDSSGSPARDGAAGGSGAVFFTGCSLGCIFCQNISISRDGKDGPPKGRPVSAEDLCRIFLDLQEQGAYNINLVTASHLIPLVIPAMQSAREKGLRIPFVWNTSSYERPEALRALEGLVDIWLADLKFADPALSRTFSSASDYFTVASCAIMEMVRQCPAPVFSDDGLLRRGVIVRHLAMPGQRADSMKVLQWLADHVRDSVLLSLMNQYTPMPGIMEKAGSSNDPAIKALARRVSERSYEKLIDHALSLGLENGYIQEGKAAEESFIPELVRDYS